MGRYTHRVALSNHRLLTIENDQVRFEWKDYRTGGQVKTMTLSAEEFIRYWGTAYGDLAIGDYMTEAVFPTLLHQDPRYFRQGTGSGWSRLTYAMGQIFWTHRDSGGTQFNYSEIIGNSTAVAISNAYYADNRTAAEAASKLGMQLGVDMAANVLKEFWPDLERKFKRQHARTEPAASR